MPQIIEETQQDRLCGDFVNISNVYWCGLNGGSVVNITQLVVVDRNCTDYDACNVDENHH